jgi:hypothetical protein
MNNHKHHHQQQQQHAKPNRSPAEIVADAERVVASLDAKRQVVAERAVEHGKARERLAFAAHAQLDVEAGRELAEARDAALAAEREVAEIDSAMATARARLAEAKALEAKAADREQAKALRAAVRKFVEAGQRVDHALGMLARDGHALSDALREVHRLGCQFPSAQQLDTLGHICLRAAIMQTPWVRSVETVPPGQRRSFRSLVEGWAANIEASNVKPRLGESTEAA